MQTMNAIFVNTVKRSAKYYNKKHIDINCKYCYNNIQHIANVHLQKKASTDTILTAGGQYAS